jgi:quercetin dioxygenase-like cupin family protein
VRIFFTIIQGRASGTPALGLSGRSGDLRTAAVNRGFRSCKEDEEGATRGTRRIYSIGGDFCETRWMRYVKTTDDGSGGSRFEDAEAVQTETLYAENTPPVLVSSAIPATGFAFLTLPPDVRETGWHPPPGRQFVVVLDGEFEVETTDGDRRRFRPGEMVLVEDLEGRGHVTRVLTEGPASLVVIPLA